MYAFLSEGFLAFYFFDGGSIIKTVKTKENSRYILDEIHRSLSLYSRIDVV